MKKFFIFLFASMIIFCCNNLKHEVDKESVLVDNLNSAYHLKVTGSKLEGWGYQIYHGEKMMIDQSTIPAIGGNKKFQIEEDARKLGELVLNKLSGGKSDLPSVTILEIDSLGIKY